MQRSLYTRYRDCIRVYRIEEFPGLRCTGARRPGVVLSKAHMRAKTSREGEESRAPVLADPLNPERDHGERHVLLFLRSMRGSRRGGGTHDFRGNRAREETKKPGSARTPRGRTFATAVFLQSSCLFFSASSGSVTLGLSSPSLRDCIEEMM